jgi:DNA-binding SARP family transcriptional activator
VEFRVLGPLEVLDGQRSLWLGGAKQRALLALLVLNANRVVSRDRLVDALWGDDPPETAVTTVQVYVSRLRKLLGRETLVTRPPGYLLQVAADGLDLGRFERLRAAGRTQEALALWRGPALAELTEPFARVEAARLDDLRLATLEERIESDLERRKHAEVVGELQSLIAEHPHRERFRAQLMLALYRSGRQAEALEAFRGASGALDELGLEPGEELRRLERSILNQDAALTTRSVFLAAKPALPPQLALESPSPFVGRTRELATLHSLLERVEDGRGQVALLGGEAGSGKSRLVRELARGAAEEGVVVLYGASDAAIDAPYQPFADALGFLLRLAGPEAVRDALGGDVWELARLLPELGSPPDDGAADPQTARQRLHATVGALFDRVSRERPLLVIVEDVHWADGPSLQLFCDLAGRSSDVRVFLLATHRDRSEDMRGELSEALASLARIDGVRRVALRALAEADVAEFVRRSSGAEGGEVSHALHALTEGTPFLLCELWRALVEAEAFENADGALRLSRPLEELGSPQAVREVAQHRLSRLTAPTVELLELAAVAGSSFDVRVIERAAETAVDAPLEEAIASGTIEELPAPGLTYRFSHELVRRALYDRLSALRRTRLHLRVGQALEGVHGTDEQRVVPELAYHFAIAAPLGVAERAAEYNVRAGEAAVSLFSLAQAERFASAVLDLAAEGSLPWARAQSVLATAGLYLAEDGAAVHASAAAAAFAALGDVEAAAEAEVLCFRALRDQRRGEDAEAASARALALVRDRPPSRAKIAGLLSWVGALHTRGRFREALPYSREALALAEELELVPLQARALSLVASALGGIGQGDRELERAVELARGGVAPDDLQIAYSILGARMGARGRLREAARLAAAARVVAERFGLLARVEFKTAAQASIAFNLGDWERAEQFIDEWVELTARSPGRLQASWISAVRANLARARGDEATALAEAQAGLAQARETKSFQHVGRALAVVGLVLVEQARSAEAHPLVGELLTLVDDRGRALFWRWVIDVAWLLHDLRRPERPPPTRYPAWNEPAQAIGRGDLTAAAELLAATEIGAEEAYARLRAGEQLASQGRDAEAQPHLDHAAAFYRRVGGTAYLHRALAASRAKVET